MYLLRRRQILPILILFLPYPIIYTFASKNLL
nr:MAG TPA: hypothetical protein [Caudoviricetes sp.]